MEMNRIIVKDYLGADRGMDSPESEEMARLKREKSREAIALALEGNWERATEVNKGILRLFPEEVDALNRLGKAFLEMGRYAAAREGFRRGCEDRTSQHHREEESGAIGPSSGNFGASEAR